MDHNHKADVFFNGLKGYNTILYVLMIEKYGFISMTETHDNGAWIGWSKSISNALVGSLTLSQERLQYLNRFKSYSLHDDEHGTIVHLNKKDVQISIKKVYCKIENYDA
jgi:hypothetical protein